MPTWDEIAQFTRAIPRLAEQLAFKVALGSESDILGDVTRIVKSSYWFVTSSFSEKIDWALSDKTIHDPREKAKLFSEYRDSMGVSEGLACDKAFDSYQSDRIQGISGFNKLTTPDGTAFSEKFKTTTPDTEAVTQAIKRALTLTQQTNDDIEAYKVDINALNNIIKTDPPRFYPEDIASQLQVIKGKAKTTIDAQNVREQNALDDLFIDRGFINHLKNSLAIDDTQIDKVKQDMKAALDKSKDEVWTKFEKEVNDHANKLHQANAKEFDRISFLAQKYQDDIYARHVIDQKAAERQAAESASLSYNYDTGNATLKNVTVQDLLRAGALRTELMRLITETADGGVAIKFNRLYQSDSSIASDLTSLAAAVKALGHESITTEVSAKDADDAQELGRKAYEAAIAAGFPPDKITISVRIEKKNRDDKDMKYDAKNMQQLFAGEPSRLTKANHNASKTDKLTKAYLGNKATPTGTPSVELRQALQAERAKIQAQATASAASSVPVGSHGP